MTTPTKPTIDSLIDDFDDNLTVMNPDDKEYESYKKDFKQSLLQLVLDELIGNYEMQDEYAEKSTFYRNELKEELRQRAREVFDGK